MSQNYIINPKNKHKLQIIIIREEKKLDLKHGLFLITSEKHETKHELRIKR